jgi:hypothetical protein
MHGIFLKLCRMYKGLCGDVAVMDLVMDVVVMDLVL